MNQPSPHQRRMFVFNYTIQLNWIGWYWRSWCNYLAAVPNGPAFDPCIVKESTGMACWLTVTKAKCIQCSLCVCVCSSPISVQFDQPNYSTTFPHVQRDYLSIECTKDHRFLSSRLLNVDIHAACLDFRATTTKKSINN